MHLRSKKFQEYGVYRSKKTQNVVSIPQKHAKKFVIGKMYKLVNKKYAYYAYELDYLLHDFMYGGSNSIEFHHELREESSDLEAGFFVLVKKRKKVVQGQSNVHMLSPTGKLYKYCIESEASWKIFEEFYVEA